MMQSRVDFLSYTFKDRSLDEVVQDFGWSVSDLEDLGHGGYGYSRCLSNNSIRFYSDGREDMGILVSLTGSGCRSLESLSCFFDWRPWIKGLLAMGARITRMDVALDERSGRLSMEKIEGKIRRCEWSGKSRAYTTMASTKGRGSEGRTVYVGAPKSPLRVRVYDKAVQMGVPGPWVRVELQMRQERARAFCERFVAAQGEEEQSALVQGVLRNYLDFKTPGEGKVVSRWKTSPWWEKFLEGAEAVSILGAEKDTTVEDLRAWLMQSVAPALAFLVKVDGGSHKFLHDLVWEGLGRISDKRWKLIKGQQSLDIVEDH